MTLRTNADTRQMRAAIREFAQNLKRGGIGLFYFAGHGVQSRNGRNYLIPVGADLKEEFELEDEAVDANRVLAGMEEAGNRVNIVILDACRNNPFARSWRSAAGGLAQMSAPTGSFVGFATAPGSVAADGSGRNGIYTKHLLESLREGDPDIDRVFTRVTAAVAKETGNKQVPWKSSSLTGDFYFRPPAGGSAQAVSAPSVAALDPAAIELALWDNVKDSKSAEELNAYLGQFPTGRFAALAKARLGALPPGQPASSPSPGGALAPADAAANERAFWDSVKETKNPDEMKAYLDQYPRGLFAALAQARLKALQSTQVASIAPGVAETTKGPVNAPALPKEGDFWRYQGRNHNGPDNPTHRVTKVGSGTVELRYVTNIGEQMALVLNSDWNPILQLGQQGLAELRFVPYASQFQFPLEPGKKWRSRYKGECGLLCNFEVNSESEVRGWERIKVPAGTFDALRIDVRDSYNHPFGATGAATGSVWLAPEVKRPVKYEYTYSGKTINDYELESYQIAK